MINSVPPPGVVTVWDPLVRIFHWSLVASFFTAYLTGEEWLDMHVWSGYLIGGLILFRLVWGVIGPQHARFSDFVHGPATVLGYARDLAGGRGRRYLGHNPLGGAMVVALLVMLTVTTLSGLWYYAVHRQQGPFAGLVVQVEQLAPIAPAHAHKGERHGKERGRDREKRDDRHEQRDNGAEEFWGEIHEISANLTLLLVGLHVGGVLLSSLLHRENLVRAMVTGRKRA